MSGHLRSLAEWAWETSLAASVLIIIVFVLRLALRKSAQPALMHFLGLLILARLFLPAAPQSPASVFNLVDEPMEAQSVQRIPAPQTISRPKRDWLPLIWAAGVFGLLGRVMLQHWRVRRWVRKGTTTVEPALEEACAMQGLKRRPDLVIAPEIQVPALFGYFKPKILLPPRLAGSQELRMIFLHELAHVRRRHVLINWVAIVAQALHWFNPLVWLAMRRLRMDQELLCDRDVVRLIGPDQSRDYGETLLALASENAQPLSTVLPISANFKQVKERIRMITQFRPLTKRALVLLAIFVATLSAATFTRAVDKTKSAKAIPERAEIERLRDLARNLELLENELHRQNDSVTKGEREVDRLRAELGIIGDPPNSESLSSLHVEKIRGLWSEVSRLEAKIRERRDAARTFRASTAESDSVISRLTLEREKSEKDLARLEQDHSAKHPEVKAARQWKKRLEAQIDERFESIRNSMTLAAEYDTESLDQLRAKVAETEKEYQSFVERSRPYFRAKRDLEMRQQVRDSIHIRLLQEKVDAQIRPR